MTHFLKSLLFLSTFLLSFSSKGQDFRDPIHNYPLVHNYPSLPPGVMPMQYNGSFAGLAGSPRVNTVFAKSRAPYNFYTSYDQFIPAIATGIGVTAGYNILGTHLSGHFISLAVAPKLSMKGKYTISPSIDFNYYNRKEIPHGMARNSGWAYTKSEFMSSKVGLLFNSKKFFIGYSVYVYNYRERKLNGQIARGKKNDFISNLQLGYTFQSNSKSKFSFSPQVALWITERYYSHFNHYYIIKNPASLAFNFNFRYDQFLWGLNSTGYQLGWQSNKLRFLASSNLTGIMRDSWLNNRLGYENYGILSLSVRYIFKNSDQGFGSAKF